MSEYSAQRYAESVEDQKLKIEHDIMTEAYKGKLRAYMDYIYISRKCGLVDWIRLYC